MTIDVGRVGDADRAAHEPSPSAGSRPYGEHPSRWFTFADLQAAFKAGWNERNRSPGLKRRVKATFDNIVLSAMGGGRYADVEYVPDRRTYHASIWTNSAFRKAIATEARRAETENTGSVHEGADPKGIAQ